MLILAVITGIIIWRIVIYCQQDKDEEKEHVSMRTKLKQTVIKYKVFIAVGSCISSVIGGLWIYFMYIQPLLNDHITFHFEATWEIGPKESWASHFEKMTMPRNNGSYVTLEENKKCPQFSRENFISIIENFSNFSSDNEWNKAFETLKMDRPDWIKTMYADNKSYPVIVIQATPYNYLDVRKLVKHTELQLVLKYPDLKLIIFDMGLTFQQKYKLLNCSQCEILEHLPEIQAYYWTPVLLYLSLQRYDSVIWIHPQSHINTETFDNLLQKTKSEEIQILLRKNSLRTRQNGKAYPKIDSKSYQSKLIQSLTQSNNDKTSQFEIVFESDNQDSLTSGNNSIPVKLSSMDNPCLHLIPNIHSEWISIRRNKFTMDAIIKPWVLCALSGHCVSTSSCKPVQHYQDYRPCDHSDLVLKRILVSLFNDMFANFYYNTQ